MLGRQSAEPASTGRETGESSHAGVPNAENVIEQPATAPRPLVTGDACPISPESIVEAMLFVGRPNGQPLSAREIAAAMRGVSPSEVEAAVGTLNAVYLRDGAPYAIVQESTGFRLVLREQFCRVRDKLYGRIRESRLSPAAIEVLSLVAYHQPISLARIDQLRGSPSGGMLRSLVRRELVRMERPADRSGQPSYRTTGRFLRLFGLENLDELPRNTELEAA